MSTARPSAPAYKIQTKGTFTPNGTNRAAHSRGFLHK
eukprot:CAMPEP_0204030290 /NCGR_PEP_ID=MMETSP0360-20130528/58859_1 /ASSEMBLY_ACC=CAM_ASM_000342 /TAXON_ID=268821 /ORGANISM="Scrippsiella Hangoei, Strain SHTV-5" /LENGTH=36 /DNA_ID= /DNA_START= /DNA_END= /DNA_ORIENTATION=